MKALVLLLLPLNLFAQVATILLSDGTLINNAPSGRDWSNYAVTGFSLGYTEYQVLIDDNNPVTINGITILTSGYQNQPPDNVYPPIQIFDDDLSTKWAAKGFGQWVQFSLPEIRKLQSIDVAFTVGDRNDVFDLLISIDSINWTIILDKQIGELGTNFDNYDFVDIEAKYIKFVAQGNVQNVSNWNSISEIRFNYVDPIPNEDCIPDTVYLPSDPIIVHDTIYIDTLYLQPRIFIKADSVYFELK